jgi:hypothetical protein
VGTREYLRHIEAKTHGLIKKPTLAHYLKEGNPEVLGDWESQSAVARATYMSAIEEEQGTRNKNKQNHA